MAARPAPAGACTPAAVRGRGRGAALLQLRDLEAHGDQGPVAAPRKAVAGGAVAGARSLRADARQGNGRRPGSAPLQLLRAGDPRDASERAGCVRVVENCYVSVPFSERASRAREGAERALSSARAQLAAADARSWRDEALALEMEAFMAERGGPQLRGAAQAWSDAEDQTAAFVVSGSVSQEAAAGAELERIRAEYERFGVAVDNSSSEQAVARLGALRAARGVARLREAFHCAPASCAETLRTVGASREPGGSSGVDVGNASAVTAAARSFHRVQVDVLGSLLGLCRGAGLGADAAGNPLLALCAVQCEAASRCWAQASEALRGAIAEVAGAARFALAATQRAHDTCWCWLDKLAALTAPGMEQLRALEIVGGPTASMQASHARRAAELRAAALDDADGSGRVEEARVDLERNLGVQFRFVPEGRYAVGANGDDASVLPCGEGGGAAEGTQAHVHVSAFYISELPLSLGVIRRLLAHARRQRQWRQQQDFSVPAETRPGHTHHDDCGTVDSGSARVAPPPGTDLFSHHQWLAAVHHILPVDVALSEEEAFALQLSNERRQRQGLGVYEDPAELPEVALVSSQAAGEKGARSQEEPRFHVRPAAFAVHVERQAGRGRISRKKGRNDDDKNDDEDDDDDDDERRVLRVPHWVAVELAQLVGCDVPSPAQHEAAMRGAEGLVYPWGNTADAANAFLLPARQRQRRRRSSSSGGGGGGAQCEGGAVELVTAYSAARSPCGLAGCCPRLVLQPLEGAEAIVAGEWNTADAETGGPSCARNTASGGGGIEYGASALLVGDRSLVRATLAMVVPDCSYSAEASTTRTSAQPQPQADGASAHHAVALPAWASLSPRGAAARGGASNSSSNRNNQRRLRSGRLDIVAPPVASFRLVLPAELRPGEPPARPPRSLPAAPGSIFRPIRGSSHSHSHSQERADDQRRENVEENHCSGVEGRGERRAAMEPSLLHFVSNVTTQQLFTRRISLAELVSLFGRADECFAARDGEEKRGNLGGAGRENSSNAVLLFSYGSLVTYREGEGILAVEFFTAAAESRLAFPPLPASALPELREIAACAAHPARDHASTATADQQLTRKAVAAALQHAAIAVELADSLLGREVAAVRFSRR